MIKITQKGNFKKYNKTMEKLKNIVRFGDLDKYGQQGVNALQQATPVDTGKTSASWSYEISRTKNSTSIIFKNSNIQNGVPIAIILQYGHITGTGAYVQGIDYINPALAPIFNKIADEAWKEVTSS